MNNAIYTFPLPENEPIFDYFEGSRERILLDREMKKQSDEILLGNKLKNQLSIRPGLASILLNASRVAITVIASSSAGNNSAAFK